MFARFCNYKNQQHCSDHKAATKQKRSTVKMPIIPSEMEKGKKGGSF